MHFLPNLTVRKIMHIADIHLPGINQGEHKCRRAKEYEFAINNLIDAADELRGCDAICVIAGDVFDRANHNPAETVRLFNKLISGISASIPVFMIAGNHDFDTKQFNMHEPHIGDYLYACMSPDMSGEVHYLSSSAYYKVGTNIGLGVYTAQDIYKHTLTKTTLDALRTAVPPDGGALSPHRINFALYHGSIDSHKLATSKSFFTGYDYGLMGDMHYFCVNGTESEPNVPITLRPGFSYVYPGSILQINASENLRKHGYVLWELTDGTVTVTQREIEQACGTITMAICDRGIDTYCTTRSRDEFHDRQTLLSTHKLPSTLTIVLRNDRRNMLTSAKRQEIKGAFASKGITIADFVADTQSRHTNAPTDVIEGALSPSPERVVMGGQGPTNVFEPLVIDCSYLSNFIKEELPDEEVDDILGLSDTLALNEVDAATMSGDALSKFRTLQSKLSAIKATVNRSSVVEDRGTFKLLYAEWDYILVYGVGNYINFTSAEKRVVLIDGKNNYGKSSILEVIYFGLYSECVKSRSGNDSQMVSTYTQADKMTGSRHTAVIPAIKITFSLKDCKYYIMTTFAHDKTSAGDGFDVHTYKKNVRIYQQSPNGEYQPIAEGANAGKWVDAVISKDTFLRVCMITQTNDSDFFSLSNAEQYKTLETMFNIDVTGNMLKYIETSIDCYESFMTNARNCIDIYSRAPYPIDFEPQEFRENAIRAISQEYEYSQAEIDRLSEVTNRLRLDIARLTANIDKYKSAPRMIDRSVAMHPIDLHEVYRLLTGDELDDAFGSKLDHYRDIIGKLDTWLACNLRELTERKVICDAAADTTALRNLRQAPLIAQEFNHLYAKYEELCAVNFSVDIVAHSNTYTHIPHFNSIEEWHSMENTLKVLLTNTNSTSTNNKFRYADVPAIRGFINKCIELSSASHAISAKYDAHRAEGEVIKAALVDDLEQIIRAADPLVADGCIAELASEFSSWRFTTDEEMNTYVDAVLKLRQYTKRSNALDAEFATSKQEYERHLTRIVDLPFNANCDACQMQPHNMVKFDMEVKMARILESRVSNLRDMVTISLLLPEYASKTPSDVSVDAFTHVNNANYYADIVSPFIAQHPPRNGNSIYAHISKLIVEWNHIKNCRKLLDSLDGELDIMNGIPVCATYCEWAAVHSDLTRELESASRAYQEYVSAHAAYISAAIEMISNEWQLYERRRQYEVNKAQRQSIGGALVAMQHQMREKCDEYTKLNAKCKHNYALLIDELATELDRVTCEYNEANTKLTQMNARRDGYNRAVYNYDDNCEKYEKIMDLNYRHDEVLDMRDRYAELLPIMKRFQNDVFDTQIMPTLSKRVTQLLNFITNSDSESVLMVNHKMLRTHRFEMYHQDSATGTRCQISKLGGYKSSLIAFILRIVMQCVLSRDNVCCRQLFIDEAFNAADGYNIQDVPALLRHLISAGVYDSILFVTHNTFLKEEFGDDSITITKPEAKCSSVQYGSKPIPPTLNFNSEGGYAPPSNPRTETNTNVSHSKCAGMTKKGEPCKKPPKGSTPYCHIHGK